MSEYLFNFMDRLASMGLEHFNVLYSSYRGFVMRNDDPEGRGRIQAHVPVLGSPVYASVWLDPVFHDSGVNRGSFMPPEIGDTVWVSFERGRPDLPLFYKKGWHGKNQVPSEFAHSTVSGQENKVPEVRGFISRMGHKIIWSDKKGDEWIRIMRHVADPGDPAVSDRSKTADRSKGKYSSLLLEPDGSVLLMNTNGTFLHLDASNGEFKIVDENKNVISTDAAGIKLVDKSGNSMSLADGKFSVLCGGEVTLNAPSLNAKTGGCFLGNGAIEPVVLGQTWSLARATMNSQLFATFTALAAAATASPFTAALGPLFTQAATAITTFEAQAVSFLSLRNKTV